MPTVLHGQTSPVLWYQKTYRSDGGSGNTVKYLEQNVLLLTKKKTHQILLLFLLRAPKSLYASFFVLKNKYKIKK